jgi:hypothetical protein
VICLWRKVRERGFWGGVVRQDLGASEGIGKWGGLLIVSGDGDNGKVSETTLVECLPVILFFINGF